MSAGRVASMRKDGVFRAVSVVADHRGMVGGAIARRLASADGQVLAVSRAELGHSDPPRTRAWPANPAVCGGGQGGRRPRRRRSQRPTFPRDNPADRDQPHRGRTANRGRKAGLPGLEPHLSEAGPATRATNSGQWGLKPLTNDSLPPLGETIREAPKGAFAAASGLKRAPFRSALPSCFPQRGKRSALLTRVRRSAPQPMVFDRRDPPC